MTDRERIVVAMSGGVDSSVAAARLKRQGFEVVGVTLHLWDTPDDDSVQGRCCAPEDVHDARRVADTLGIPHFAFDRRALFESEVVAPFVDAYLAGTTPSPCVRCNRGVKMRELFHLADRLGAAAVATGHYARVMTDGSRVRLHRGVDPNKDQSYFLFTLSPGELERVRFPLGAATKSEVRQEALDLGLPGAHKGESQELCFVPTGHYGEFVAARAGARLRPGAIVDAEGRRLGEHAGVHRFTIGQRKNLGVALGERAYVVDVDAETATVRLGGPDALLAGGATLDDVTLADSIEPPFRCLAQVRYRGMPNPATVRAAGGSLRVEFDEPVRAVVPGQVAVFYADDRVLGGGTITRALVTASSTERLVASPALVSGP